MLVFLLLKGIAGMACSVDEGPPLGELIHEGLSVVILTPVEIIAPKPPNLEAVQGEGVSVHLYLPITVRVRVVEVLVGNSPNIDELTYIYSWCGGHKVEVGRYYVLAVKEGERRHDLLLGGNELLGLGDEYLEEVGAGTSNSVLIQALLRYRDTQVFKLTPTMLRPYREITTPRYEAPSEGVGH